MLLSRGVSVETVDPAGRTPLHLAAEYGWPELVDLLLGRGASITSRARDGQLPLHVAVGSRAEQATMALLGAGAPVDAVDDAGRRPSTVGGRAPEVIAGLRSARPGLRVIA